MTEIAISEIMKMLPHGYPFLLVDRVLDVVADKRIKTLKNISYNEPFFRGHFPGNPVLPGVLMIEALAQTAGLLALYSTGQKYHQGSRMFLTGVDGVRFKRQVIPGDSLIMEVEEDRCRGAHHIFSGQATVAGELATSATLRLIVSQD